MIKADKGFPSKYDGICMVCKAYYHTGDKIATHRFPTTCIGPMGPCCGSVTCAAS